jgi:hypothetical protein
LVENKAKIVRRRINRKKSGQQVMKIININGGKYLTNRLKWDNKK